MEQHIYQNIAPKGDNHTAKKTVGGGKENNINSSRTNVLQARQVNNLNNSSLIQNQANTKDIIQFGKIKWRTKSVDEEIKAYGSKKLKGGHKIDTGHHKIGKMKLLKYRQSLSNKLRARLDKKMGFTSDKDLMSFRPNLTLGTNSGLVEGDPGDKFDGNTFKDGSLTPRSRRLKEVDGIIDGGGLTKDEVKRVIYLLKKAKKYHKKKVPSEKIDGDVSMWKETGKHDKPYKRGPVDKSGY